MQPALFYKAFISYSHIDHKYAAWLHKALEAYAIPRHLRQAGSLKRLTPIFRDKAELPASADLSETIKQALAQSEYLIVLCSPEAAASNWVNSEILEFKRLHGEAKLLSIIIRGIPLASDSAFECFPEALRYTIGTDGNLSGVPCEPIAADLRAGGDGKRLAKLKLVAGMLGVGLDQIVQRDSKRRQRAMTFVTAGAICGMLVMSYLAWSAIDSRRQAEVRRAESEDLVAFMLGDLRQKLEPVGRLDVLGAVGGKVLAHYAKEPASSLSNNNLQQQAKALALLGDIERQRGDDKAALAAVEQASAVTAELMLRQPNNQQYIFDHAQNQFLLGQVSVQTGNLAAAAKPVQNYEILSHRLVALAPANPKWQLEVAYAQTNQGILRLRENQPVAALLKFDHAEAMLDALNDTANDHASLMEKASLLSWKAQALARLLRLDDAIVEYKKQKLIYEALLKQDQQDEQVSRQLQTAMIQHATLVAANGDVSGAIKELENANQLVEHLVRHDPKNKLWRERQVSAQLALAELVLADKQTHRAITLLDDIKSNLELLNANSKTGEPWILKLTLKHIFLQATLSYNMKKYQQALDLLSPTLQHTHNETLSDPDDWMAREMGHHLYLYGEIAREMSKPELALVYWRKTVARLSPYALTGDAYDRDILARAEFRLGDLASAQVVVQQLNKKNYRYPAYIQFWKAAQPDIASGNFINKGN